jgi:hypothetical protein
MFAGSWRVLASMRKNTIVISSDARAITAPINHTNGAKTIAGRITTSSP